MSLVVKTNVSSLMSQRHLNATNRGLQSSMSRLSSGFRINTAADDAAGLAVSEEMKADIRSLGQASRNALDGISVVQTAEGALGDIGNTLVRMRELAVQANNSSLSREQRSHIQTEFNELISEIDDIAQRTQFNGNSLLTGSVALNIQVGIEATDLITIDLPADYRSATASLGAASGNVAIASIRLEDLALSTYVASFTDILGSIDTAISQVTTQRAALGAMQNRLEVKLDNMAVYRENLEAANSRIRDVDFASEMATMTKQQILMQSGTAMLAQANAMPQNVLSLLR